MLTIVLFVQLLLLLLSQDPSMTPLELLTTEEVAEGRRRNKLIKRAATADLN